MNQRQDFFATACRIAATAARAVRRTLLWFTGAPASAIEAHEDDVQMAYTAMGLTVAIWYLFMVIVWSKTGAHYYGTGGAFTFVLVPTLVLAMDRMILRQVRNPAGELAAFALPELRPHRLEYALRIAASLAFSAVTTQAFLVTQSAVDIRVRQQQDQFLANEPLRREYAGQIDSQHRERMNSVASRTAEVEAQAKLHKEEFEAARKLADDTEQRARQASYNVAAEVGGIEGRVAGAGRRHDAYALLARQNQDTAVNARAREVRARENLAKVLADLQQQNAARERATGERNAAMRDLEETLQTSPRFVARKHGMFADATTLIRLYGDKDIGAGLLLTTVLAAALLFILECAPMLGLAFHSATTYDVERIARNRANSARLVAEQEIELMQSASRRTVRVRPAQPHDVPAAHKRDQAQEEDVQ
jgi:hypothetical protein